MSKTEKKATVNRARPHLKGVYQRSATVFEVTVLGKTRRVNVPSDWSRDRYKSEIERVQAELKAELGQHHDTSGQPTFDELVNDYVFDRRLKASSERVFRNKIKGFSLDNDANRRRMRAIFERPYAPDTRRGYIKSIRGLFAYIIDREDTVYASDGKPLLNPCARIKPPKAQPRQRVFTADELDLLWDALETRGNKVDELYLRLLRFTGARCSTLLQVRPCDMDAEFSLGLVNVKLSRRYGCTIAIKDARTQELWRAVTGGLKTTDHLFDDRTMWRCRALIKRLFAKDANGESLNLHSFRHSRATELIRNGVPVSDVGRLLDVSPTILLSVYTTPNQSDLDKYSEIGCELV